jgi:CheY-like chemotaxis protein
MFELVSPKELPVVLLIDDDLVSREVTATLLTMSGYSVHTAENGAAALKMLAAAKCQPEVILMDAQMPGLSGMKLIAALRARSKARIYAISGSNPLPEVIAAADGLLLKPFDAEALKKLFDVQKPESVFSLLDPNQPVISAEILAQFRKMMPEPSVRQIYAAVVADLGRRIEALAAAIAKRDAAEVRRIGHAIKGGCGMAGALQAAHLGALLESTPLESQDNQLDNSAILLRDLRAAASALERMLEDEFSA